MAINFPDNPTHGQSATLAGKSFTYDSDVSGWNVSSSASLDLSSIAQDILPDADSSRSLGSVSKKWKDLYLSGSTIHLGGLQLQNKLGQLSVADSTGKDISGFNTAPRFNHRTQVLPSCGLILCMLILPRLFSGRALQHWQSEVGFPFSHVLVSMGYGRLIGFAARPETVPRK